MKNPAPREWRMEIRPRGSASPFAARAFTRHADNHVAVAVRYPSVIPNGEIFVYAYPKNMGLAVTSDKPIVATVTRPDGSTETLELFDRGRDPSGRSDDVPGDGVFTGVYRATAQTGAYQFLVSATIADWLVSEDVHEHRQRGPSTSFVREARLSTAAGRPSDVETTPEDPPAGQPSWCARWTCLILALLLLLILLNLLLTWRCCRQARR